MKNDDGSVAASTECHELEESTQTALANITIAQERDTHGQQEQSTIVHQRKKKIDTTATSSGCEFESHQPSSEENDSHHGYKAEEAKKRKNARKNAKRK